MNLASNDDRGHQALQWAGDASAPSVNGIEPQATFIATGFAQPFRTNAETANAIRHDQPYVHWHAGRYRESICSGRLVERGAVSRKIEARNISRDDGNAWVTKKVDVTLMLDGRHPTWSFRNEQHLQRAPPPAYLAPAGDVQQQEVWVCAATPTLDRFLGTKPHLYT